MTLHELVENGLIKDEDKISLTMTTAGAKAAELRKGKWFEDRIIEWAEEEIEELEYDRAFGWNINLYEKEEEEEPEGWHTCETKPEDSTSCW